MVDMTTLHLCVHFHRVIDQTNMELLHHMWGDSNAERVRVCESILWPTWWQRQFWQPATQRGDLETAPKRCPEILQLQLCKPTKSWDCKGLRLQFSIQKRWTTCSEI
jgi:hypothetical protein